MARNTPNWLGLGQNAVLVFDHAFGFPTGPRPGAGNSRTPSARSARPPRAVPGLCQDVAGRLRRRPGLGAARHRRAAPLDDGGGIQRDLCAVPFPAGTEHRQPVRRVRRALWRHFGRYCRLRRAARPAHGDRDRSCGALCPLWRDRRAAADPGRGVLRRRRAFDRGRAAHDDAAGRKARRHRQC